MNASGRTVNSSRASSLSNPSGSRIGFRSPVSAAASPGVCVPTPWLRASWLPKQDSHGMSRPPAVNSRSGRLEQARVMREAELAAEEVRPVRADAVGLPEDVVRPVQGLDPGVAGAAGVRA